MVSAEICCRWFDSYFCRLMASKEGADMRFFSDPYLALNFRCYIASRRHSTKTHIQGVFFLAAPNFHKKGT